ncbi:MAG: SEC-C metal-binding domain-containing protein [Coriobacteriales bacterium]|nr:SEC-C metal-binding domain-containing protein [Coriobacteriales bacterium]
MKLPLRMAMRFFRLFDLLGVYAHHRLRVVSDDEFFNGEPPRGISEVGERLTTDELWKSLDIIDDYVRENPDNLSAADLDRVKKWSCAHTAIVYIARCKDGKLRFLADEYAVEVCGMSVDIASALPRIPVLARTTLLPFDDYVVYDQMLEQLPFEPDQKILDVFQKSLDEALAAGRIIRTGQEFCDVVPAIRKKKVEDELERFRQDIEMEERANGLLEGQHRGALAGLGEEEREEVIRRHMKELHPDDGDGPLSRKRHLIDSCLPGEPVFGLQEIEELYAKVTRQKIQASAEKLIEDFQSHGKAGADGLKRALAFRDELQSTNAFEQTAKNEVVRFQDPSHLQHIINNLVEPQIERMRILAEEGGYRTCPDDPLPSPDVVPVSVEGLCCLFHTEGTFHVVMPREVVPLARKLDWEQAFSHARYLRRVSAYFECVTELRGIVELEEALDEFVRNFDDGSHSKDEVYETLLDCMEDEQVGATLLQTDEGEYLLHYELLAMYQENREEDPYPDEYVMEGPLTDLLAGLLNIQSSKKSRPVTEEMVSYDSLFSWRQAQPPALALRTFLDEHVPDDEDDYFFADGVMEELLTEQMFGFVKGSVDAFFQTLEKRGFVPDESQVQPLLTLWQNMCNGLPIWPNNGWSPNEVASQRQSGRGLGSRPVFYNPDGSTKKVGRNDPCPCGSGKKYKRCCGR